MSNYAITADSTMGDIVENYPSAQRALFQKFHIGGCNSCGYEMDETLNQVLARKGISNEGEIIDFIVESHENDQKMQISVKEVSEALNAENPPRLIDVRTPQEYEYTKIEGSELISEELARDIQSWPRDTFFVFCCHNGRQSLDAASYFAGHGFQNVRCMTGGVDQWAQEINPEMERYEIKQDRMSGRTEFVPLRSVVSGVKGCIT